MHRYLILLLSFGCSDYEVNRIEQADDASWFEETSDQYQDGFDSDSRTEDDDEDAPSDQDDVEDDTGMWDVPDEDDGEHETESTPDDDDHHSDDDEPSSDSDSEDPPHEDPPHGDPPTDSDDDHGSSSPSGGPASASSPAPGAVVITELMIHPQATDDAQGEWVEIYNSTGSWVDLTGSMLVDRGVDAVEIEPVSSGSLIVEPGGYLTICADPDYWDNGGVDCDGTFHYWTLGGGFALSNTEDEVKLISSTGSLLDEVRYSDGFSVEGESLALDPDKLNVTANDVAGNWCEQFGLLPFGDGGTPGEPNDNCY